MNHLPQTTIKVSNPNYYPTAHLDKNYSNTMSQASGSSPSSAAQGIVKSFEEEVHRLADQTYQKLQDHTTLIEKELTYLRNKNIRLSQSLATVTKEKTDAVQRLRKVEADNMRLREELSEMEEFGCFKTFKALVAFKKKLEGLEKKVEDSYEAIENRIEGAQEYVGRQIGQMKALQANMEEFMGPITTNENGYLLRNTVSP